MQGLIQYKYLYAVLILIIGAGIGTQLPLIKVSFEQPSVEVEKDIDKDGVPVLQDYKNPVVNGTKIEPIHFTKKYCDGLREVNGTCRKVIAHRQYKKDAPLRTARIAG